MMKSAVHLIALLILLAGCDQSQDLGHNISDDRDGGTGIGDGGDGGAMAADGGAIDDMMASCQKSTGLYDIDVPVILPTFEVSQAGLMDPQYANGVMLVNTTTGDRTGWVNGAQLIPGTYDIYYGTINGVANTGALMKKGVKITTSDPITLDIPIVTLRGHIKVGDGMPKSPLGTLLLRGVGGDSVVLGNASQTDYVVDFIPGTYDLYFNCPPGGCGSTLPVNRNFLLGCLEISK